MKLSKRIRFILPLLIFVPLAIITIIFYKSLPQAFAIATVLDLGTSEDFAVLAGAAISDTGTTDITGDVGLSPTGGASITGLTCAEVTGTIYDTNAGYTGGGGGDTSCLTTNAGLLTTAKSDLSIAYNDANGQTPDAVEDDGDLGGQTLTPGVYSEDGTPDSLAVTGELTLDGGGDPDAVFIFQTDSTLVTASNSTITLTNGTQACNVFWQVGSSATLGTNTTFVGTIMAAVSITDNGGSTVNGRLLADADNTDADSTGAVTLNNTTVTVPTCTAASEDDSTSSSSGATNFSEDNRCVATTPLAPQWATREQTIDGVNLLWSALGGSEVDIEITNSEGIYEYKYVKVANTGHMFLPGVTASQSIRIRVFNECEYGDWLLVSTAPNLPNTGFAPNTYTRD